MREPRPWPDDAPSVKEQVVTLVAEDGAGSLVWATGVGDKRKLLAGTRGPLYAFWKGRHSTHLFEIDRRRAAADVGEGKADTKREVPDEQRRLISFHARECQRVGFVTVHARFDAETVRAAGSIVRAADRPTIKAVLYFGLRDDYWRDRLFTIPAWWRQWDRLKVAWERADRPPYEPEEA